MSEAMVSLSNQIKKQDAESDGNGWLKVIVRNKSNFHSDTLRLVKIADSIYIIIGVVKAKTIQLDVQAIRFFKKDFSTQEAQDWVANNYKVNKIFKF